MPVIRNAILHLREAGGPLSTGSLALAISALRGVRGVRVLPVEHLVIVRFEHRAIGLADIVREIELQGSAVASVAQRQLV